MAPVSLLQSPHQSVLRPHLFTAPAALRDCKKNIYPSAICCKNNSAPEQLSVCVQDQSQVKRREALFQTAFATILIPTIAPLALAETSMLEEFRTYSDDVNKFQILIPQDWEVGAGEGNGIKSVIAFYPSEPSSSSNVSIVITGLGPDFTRLESFGKVDAFAENLVSGLDRSWKKPPGVAAKLIDSKAKNGLYYIEYSLQKPGESQRHLFSVLGVANNGWYNRLYTLTGQFVEEEAEKYGPKIEKVGRLMHFRFSEFQSISCIEANAKLDIW